jgi:hypothetical protein
LSAFTPVGFEIEKSGMTRAFHARFFDALDKIRWLIPTESVDDLPGCGRWRTNIRLRTSRPE